MLKLIEMIIRVGSENIWMSSLIFKYVLCNLTNKLFELLFVFTQQGLPVGGNILNYLLEKSRVINQAPGERNFHIFYQLLAGASDSELDDLLLKRNLSLYYYLSHGVRITLGTKAVRFKNVLFLGKIEWK